MYMYLFQLILFFPYFYSLDVLLFLVHIACLSSGNAGAVFFEIIS